MTKPFYSPARLACSAAASPSTSSIKQGRLRLLVRSTADTKLKSLLDCSAEIVEGDLTDRASLEALRRV